MKKEAEQMDIQVIMIAGVSIGIVLLVWFLCRDFICKLIERILLGVILMFMINWLIPQYAIGFNWLTMGCAGVLGVPGVMTLYVVNAVI